MDFKVDLCYDEHMGKFTQIWLLLRGKRGTPEGRVWAPGEYEQWVAQGRTAHYDREMDTVTWDDIEG